MLLAVHACLLGEIVKYVYVCVSLLLLSMFRIGD